VPWFSHSSYLRFLDNLKLWISTKVFPVLYLYVAKFLDTSIKLSTTHKLRFVKAMNVKLCAITLAWREATNIPDLCATPTTCLSPRDILRGTSSSKDTTRLGTIRTLVYCGLLTLYFSTFSGGLFLPRASAHQEWIHNFAQRVFLSFERTTHRFQMTDRLSTKDKLDVVSGVERWVRHDNYIFLGLTWIRDLVCSNFIHPMHLWERKNIIL